MKKNGIKEIIESRQFPGLAGVSDGPGSGANEIVFDRPDVAKETEITLRKMEAEGQIKDPKVAASAKKYLSELKAKPPRKLDYQKEGHPLDG